MACLLLSVLLWPDPSRHVDATEVEKPMPQAPDTNVADPEGTTVSEAYKPTEPDFLTSVVSDQPARTVSSTEASTEANESQPVEVEFPAPFVALPATRKWSDDDVAAVAALAKEFNDAVMGSANSPDSPAYYDAWMTAERRANEQYRAYFGDEAFNALRQP